MTLLFTNIVLPGMSGRRLADVLAARSLGLKLLFTTGHTHDIDALDDDAGLLRKPFDLRRLAFAVRAAIDR